MYVFNPNAQEMEAGDPEGQSHPKLHSEFSDTLR